VTTRGKLRITMRLRSREIGYPRPGEPDRLHQSHVARRTRRIRRVEVRAPDPVAVETVLRNRRPHAHGIVTLPGVAGAASERGVGAAGAGHGTGVAHVGESKVADPRRNRRIPFHRFFDAPLVTGCAVGRAGPKGPAGILRPGVASEAARKERAMLPVIEAVLEHAGRHTACANEQGQQEGQEAQGSGFHRDPARDRPRNAGGRGTASVSLRKSSVRRARSRV